MMTRSIRIASTALAAGAIFLASAVVPATSMSLGGGAASGLHAGWSSPLHAGPDSAAHAHLPSDLGFKSSSVVKNGAVSLAKKKKAGKLNGACYRSCVKTSMGDAFRTDQFCAYSCSLD